MSTKAGLPKADSPDPNTLTPELIAELKQMLASRGLPEKLYKFTIGDQEVVFRPLLIGDYVVIQEFIAANDGRVKQDEIDFKICEKATLWPQDLLWHEKWEVQLAGLQSTLSKQVLARSGFFVDEIDQSEFMAVEPLTTVDPGPKPEPAVVQELKARFKFPLKLIQVDGEYFAVRPLSRAEWKVVSAGDAAEMDLAVAERATVWSKESPTAPNFADRVAGTARTISELVMAISGFSSQATVEEL